MKYFMRFIGRAPDDIQGLSPELLAHLWPNLDRLSEAPVSLSIPGAPPASLPNRQIFPFQINLPDGREFTMRVHFRYGQDEQTLFVLAVTAIQHARGRYLASSSVFEIMLPFCRLTGYDILTRPNPAGSLPVLTGADS